MRAREVQSAERKLRALTRGQRGSPPPFKRAALELASVQNDGFGHFEAAPEARAVLDGLGQHILAHIGAKVPQLQVEEVEKIRAARGLFNVMSRGQLAKVLGITSVVELASTSAVALETSFVLMAVEAWSAGRMDAFVRTWRSVILFVTANGYSIPAQGRLSGLRALSAGKIACACAGAVLSCILNTYVYFVREYMSLVGI